MIRFACCAHRASRFALSRSVVVSASVAEAPKLTTDTMKKVQLGKSDLQVSVACLGTMVRYLWPAQPAADVDMTRPRWAE
jgi:hypothetical protein